MKVFGALLLLTLVVPAQTQWQGQPFTVRAVAPGVYSFSAAFYSNLFIVTSEGVVATDPISPAVAALYAKAIKQVTTQPVRYVIYSHDHTDHIAGGKVFADTAQFIAHENTRANIAARGNADIVPPQITFKTDYTLQLGGKAIRLLYFGENHSNGNIGIYLAAEKILMLVDMVYPGSVPFRDLPGTDLRKFLETLQRVRELDFKTLIYGHGPPGGKEWVDKYIDYFNDLIAAVKKSESEVTYYHVMLEQRESDPRKVLDAYIERIAARAVEAIRAKYGQWGGFDDWAPMNATRVVLFLMMDG